MIKNTPLIYRQSIRLYTVQKKQIKDTTLTDNLEIKPIKKIKYKTNEDDLIPDKSFDFIKSVKKNLNGNGNGNGIIDKPIGYEYFTKLYELELPHLINYLKRQEDKIKLNSNGGVNLNFDVFKKEMNSNKVNSLINTLKRNNNYLDYLIYDLFKIEKNKIKYKCNLQNYNDSNFKKFDFKEGELRGGDGDLPVLKKVDYKIGLFNDDSTFNDTSRTFGDILEIKSALDKESVATPVTPVSAADDTRTFGEELSRLKKPGHFKKESNSFKSLLKSLNKIKKNDIENNEIISKMSNFTPITTINHNDLNSDIDNLETYLNSAKLQFDSEENLKFKSKLNYEWSKQQLNKNPKTLENKNFFTRTTPATATTTANKSNKLYKYVINSLAMVGFCTLTLLGLSYII